MERPEKQQVIDAINTLKRRVTAADIASKTGLPLHIANSLLNKVAAETNGHLEVSTAGDIVYKFSPGFESKYFATGIRKVFETVGTKLFEILYFLLRISFGVMLVLSFIAVIVLILIAVLALSRLGSDDDNGGGNFNFDFFDFMILRDLLYWGAWCAPNPYIDYDRPASRRPQEKKSNFLFNVFSFLFGDGNPNTHLEERMWQMIAEVIRNNQGVVTAEQLAPYTGADPKNEDGVLPVLVRFDGKPEVTETGNIVYVFPSMQVRGTLSHFKSGSVPGHLREYLWTFTNVPQGDLVPVYVLATVNFFGSWWLLFMGHGPALSIFYVHFAPLIVALSIYGTAFLLVPLIRYLILQWKNNNIVARNGKREEMAIKMQNRSGDLAKKLEEAASYAINSRTVDSQNMAYSTEKDNLEQEFTEALSAHDQLAKLHNQYLQRAGETKVKPAQNDSAPRLPDHQNKSPIDNVIYLKDKDKHPLHRQENNESLNDQEQTEQD